MPIGMHTNPVMLAPRMEKWRRDKGRVDTWGGEAASGVPDEERQVRATIVHVFH